MLCPPSTLSYIDTGKKYPTFPSANCLSPFSWRLARFLADFLWFSGCSFWADPPRWRLQGDLPQPATELASLWKCGPGAVEMPGPGLGTQQRLGQHWWAAWTYLSLPSGNKVCVSSRMENTPWKAQGMEYDILAMLQPDSPNDIHQFCRILFFIAKRYSCRIIQAASPHWPVKAQLEGLQLSCCLGWLLSSSTL